MDKKKLIVTLLVVVVMLAGVGVGVYLVRQQQDIREKAAPATTLALFPDNPTPEVGDTFTIAVQISSGENDLIGVDIVLNYDPSILGVNTAEPGDYFPSPRVVGPSIDNTTGEVTYTVYLPGGATPITGQGTLARFNFQAKKAGTSPVTFGTYTRAAVYTENIEDEDRGVNVVAGTTPTTINVLAAESDEPTNTPTSTPSPTVTTAPGIGGAEPTNTPTSTPSPTSSPTKTPTPTEEAGIGGSESTSTPTPTQRIVNPTTGETVDALPDSGVSMPVVLGIAIGFLALLGSFAILL
jgi:hypothetical protein